MAVVAGVIFFIVRAFFALIPGLADRSPIKKWAALAALLVTGFDLILSGKQIFATRNVASYFDKIVVPTLRPSQKWALGTVWEDFGTRVAPS